MACVDKEGLLQGPDVEYLTEIKKELSNPIIESGGISSIEDLEKLDQINIDYAVEEWQYIQEKLILRIGDDDRYHIK